MAFLDTLKLEMRTWRMTDRIIAVLHTVDPVDGGITPVGTGSLGGGAATDVSALGKETTQAAVLSKLQGTLAVSNASLPLPTGATTAVAQAAMLAALQGTLSVNPGTVDRRTVISQQTLDLSAGAAVSLPAVPNGASSLQIQPQGADVRLKLDGSTPTATSGLLFGQDGIYDLYVLTNVKVIATAAAAAGLQAELIWRA
ncbi:hypothetical protein Q0M94_11870 [Deinococcus radiomollis]|uniref:hypothetical protein n=1 Tax=Deinococcus radiomollis TaxID=468916 RepID=UPI003892C66E